MGLSTLERLNIGPRLIVGFVVIILLMLAADAVVLWQFHVVRTQAGRLNAIDQTLVSVFRVHGSLLAFSNRLDALADSEDAGRLVTETAPLRAAVLEHIGHATSALRLPPFDLQRDPTVLPTLQVIESALPSQLEGIATLARAGDWQAVRLRVENQVRPLEALASELVEKVAQQAGEQQARIALDIRRVQRLVFLVVPLTAVFTLLIAATLGLAVTRSVTRPLARLVEGSKALARGEFQHRVSVSGNDELAHLGHVFNDTARRLQDLYATLQSSEDRFRRVIDTIPAHAWSALPDGSVDFINKRFLEFAGRSPEDLRGWGWSSVVHPDDLPKYVEQWEAAVAAGEPMESQARVRRADRQYRRLLIRNVPLRDESGHITNWYGIAFDIEERHRAEEGLRKAQAELAHVSRVTTLGEVTASLAHEVNQPLAAIVNNANACLGILPDRRDLDEVREGLADIVSDGDRASAIIERVRGLAKRSTPPQVPLCLADVVTDVVALAASESATRSVVIRIDVGADLPMVLGDRVQLQQVLLNLVVNGMDAMMAVAEGERVLEIRARLDRQDGAPAALLCVQDRGIGLEPGQVDGVFEAFYTTKPHGMGMGLAISRSIIEAHEGRLWAQSNHPEPGATFSFRLPVAPAAS
jgi:PAS domain S-box-containing protein